MKNISKILISALLISFIIVNVKVAQSSYWQSYLLHDFNSDTYLVPYNEVSDRISDDFPNLTHCSSIESCKG